MHAVSGQYLGEGGDAGRQWFPAHERHGPAPGLVVCPRRHGGEPGRVVVVEPHCTRRQGIERRCPDSTVAVSAQVVPAKGVRNNPDDVHTDLFRWRDAGHSIEKNHREPAYDRMNKISHCVDGEYTPYPECSARLTRLRPAGTSFHLYFPSGMNAVPDGFLVIIASVYLPLTSWAITTFLAVNESLISFWIQGWQPQGSFWI